MKRGFVHKISLNGASLEHACRMYENLCREYGCDNVRIGPAYDESRSQFFMNNQSVGFYVIGTGSETGPNLEDALSVVERFEAQDCAKGHKR